MGTKVHNLPGYCSMRDLNEESSSCGWPLFYGDKTLSNGQYYNNYLLSTTADACLTYDKDVVKQIMLEHEAEFRNQVSELHRLYRIQRDLMDELKRKELHKNKIPVESSFSTGPLVSQITSEDGQKWHVPGFPMVTYVGGRPSVSVSEGFHSPWSSAKGNSKQAGLFPSPNGSSSKDVEVLECRPSKVRRKMFDLHLPADEYIDTEESEKFSGEKISGTTVNHNDRDCKLKREGNGKLPCGKVGSPEDTSKCEQSLRTRNGLADLNEPVQVEESNASAYFPPVSHNPCQGATECSDFSSIEKSCLFDLSREELLNRHHATDIWPSNNGYMESNGNGKLRIPSALEEAGQAKSNLKSISQVLKQEKSLASSHRTQDALIKAHEPPSDYLINRRKVDIWRDKAVYDLEVGERIHEIPTNKQPDSAVSSHRSSLLAVACSPNVAKSWSHSASSWEMSNSRSSQKILSAQRPPCLNASGALSKSSASGQPNGILADSWSLNVESKYSAGFQCEACVQNGFYPGHSSGSKEPSVNVSSVSYDYLNCNNSSKGAPELFNHGSAKYCNGFNGNEMRSGKDINLNVMLSSDSSNNQVSQSGLAVMDGESKREENLPALPWLRAKSVCKNEVQNDGRGLTGRDLSFAQAASTSNKDETGKGPHGNLMHNVTSFLYSNGVEPRRTEISDRISSKKILGVPIFDMPHISPKKESSASTSLSVPIPNTSDIEAVENNRKKRVLDINLPCDVIDLDKGDDDTVTDTIAGKKESAARESNCRNLIDLNMSMCDEETSLTTNPSTNVRMVPEIDLEAPAVPEMDEDVIPEEKFLETPLVSRQELQDEVEQPEDEILRQAAEAIVAISSHSCSQVAEVVACPSESSPTVDALSWFAEVISSCVDDVEAKLSTSAENDGENNEESSSEGMDYFETMTLKLTETKEEDYMPKPLVPENIILEESGTTVLPTRTRRGPTRRGRQRRDFQRDILPGLTSLSRHEVTEDLQTFGGLMRATGHAWSSLTRRSSSRNGGGRGRRRLTVTPSPLPPFLPPPPPPPVATNETCAPLVHQLNNIEGGSEDRSLTGWGKTTRRPRRQRCAAGNPAPIPLT